jgi:multiple sugar transport system substrate-binding protein
MLTFHVINYTSQGLFMHPHKSQWSVFFLLLICVWMVLLPACSSVTPSPTSEITGITRTETASPSPRSSPTALPRTRTPTLTATPASQIDLLPGDLKGVIIQYWHFWHGPAGEVMHKLVDEFNTTNQWKMIVVPVEISSLDTMDERVRNVLSEGNGGDIPEIVMGYLYQALAWDGLHRLVELDQYVNDPVWGLSAKDQADFFPVFWQSDYSAARRLGIPAQRSAQLLFYNLGWARSLGYLEAPATSAEFQKQACATAQINRQDADSENNSTGGWVISTDYHAMLSWLSAFGSQVISPTLSTRSSGGQSPYHFDSLATQAAFKFLRSLYDQGCAWLLDGPSQGGQEYLETAFATRQALFSTGSLLDIPYQMQAFQSAEYQDDWTVIPFPGARKSQITVYGPSFNLLPSSPERQLAAWVFLKWLLEPEQQARLVQATGAFPLSQAALGALSSYSKQNPSWAAAVGLLPLAQAEPALQSWSTVRWALSDASTQLFRSYFIIDQVPSLASYLDLTAAELYQSSLPATPAPAPTLTTTGTLTPTLTLSPSSTLVPSLTPIPSRTPTP